MYGDIAAAIYKRLVGLERLTEEHLLAQKELASLLAMDSDTGLPAVHRGNSNEVSLYPAITFRESGGRIDGRFTLGRSAVGGIAVDMPIYDFEIWGKSRSNAELCDIHLRFRALLDQRYGVQMLPIASGRIDRMVTLIAPTLLYDDLRHAWCLLQRVQFKVKAVSFQLS